jgi:hypothetical protein
MPGRGWGGGGVGTWKSIDTNISTLLASPVYGLAKGRVLLSSSHKVSYMSSLSVLTDEKTCSESQRNNGRLA